MLSDEAEFSRLTSFGWTSTSDGPPAQPLSAIADPPWARALILIAALSFMALFVLLPLAAVFTEAFREGLRVYVAESAIRMRAVQSV